MRVYCVYRVVLIYFLQWLCMCIGFDGFVQGWTACGRVFWLLFDLSRTFYFFAGQVLSAHLYHFCNNSSSNVGSVYAVRFYVALKLNLISTENIFTVILFYLGVRNHLTTIKISSSSCILLSHAAAEHNFFHPAPKLSTSLETWQRI